MVAAVPLSRILADLFPRGERSRLAAVIGVSTVASCFEVLGVASILPFMTLVVDPTALERYEVLRTFSRTFGTRDARATLLVLGIATTIVVALGNAAAALNIVLQQRFAARTLTRVASELFTGYMRQPYAFHVRRDIPSIAKVVLADAYNAVNGVIAPSIMAIARGTMALGVLALLFMQDPRLAVVVG